MSVLASLAVGGGGGVVARPHRPLLPPLSRRRRPLPRTLAMSSPSSSASSSALEQQLSAASILQQLPATVRRQDNSSSSSSSSAAASTSSNALVDPDLAREGRALWQHERGRVLSGCEPVETENAGGPKEKRRGLKVALLLSGGVDSAVALHLLTEAGHDVWPFYLKIWFEEDFRNSWSSCPWEEDVEAAEAVLDSVAEGRSGGEAGGGGSGGAARRPLTLVPLTEHYWRRVVDAAVSDLRRGRTPNPDVLCNSRVKFGAFVEMLAAGEVEGFERSSSSSSSGIGGEGEGEGSVGCGFDRVASGHYASLLRASCSSPSDSSSLPLLGVARDAAKDQTYFLARLSERQLSAAMFPLGALEKREVRALAAAAGLPNAARADSQGLCFLGKVRFDEFVAAHLGKWPGPLVEEVEEGEEEVEEEVGRGEGEGEVESGELALHRKETKTTRLKRTVVGFHDGAWFFTPGQRKGIGLSGGPWFVTRKDMRTNAVFVSRSYNHHAHHSREAAANVERERRGLLEERRRKFVVGSLAWLPGGSAASAVDAARRGELQVKVRHGPGSYFCGLEEVVGPADADGGGNDPSSASSSSSSSSSESSSSESSLPASSLRLRVSLDRPDQGLAPGQFAVFYDDDRGVCVGSGVIEASGGGGEKKTL